MKNLKRAGALIVVLLLLLLYGATFFFAVTDSPDSGAWFRISLAGTIFVPFCCTAICWLSVSFRKEPHRRNLPPAWIPSFLTWEWF